MISDELLAELKQILWEDYQIKLPDKDLALFTETIKGLFLTLVQAVSKKPERVESLMKEQDVTD